MFVNLNQPLTHALSQIKIVTARDYFELGVQLRDIGQIEAARDALLKAQSLDDAGETGMLARKVIDARIPKYIGDSQANQLNSLGYRLRFEHKYDLAEQIFRLCIKRWPRFEFPYKNLGHMFIELRRFRDAKEVLEKLVEVNPNYARGWELLGQAKAGLGDKVGSKICIDRARELDPDDDAIN